MGNPYPMARPALTLDLDDIELVLSGCRHFGAVGLLARVEGILTHEDLGAPFVAWRRHRARQRLFRSWLVVR